MMLLSGFSRARKAKAAICWFFFMQGVMFGNWGGILPVVKEEQGISNTVLGGVLVAAVCGAMIALPLVDAVSKRFGSGFSLLVGGLLTVLLICLVGLRENIFVFIFAVMALGFGAGWMDVAMNCQAVLCEKMTRTPTLGLFHSMIAIGGLCGALIGGALIELGFCVLTELAILSIVQVPFVILLSCWLYSYQEEKLLTGNGLLNFDPNFKYDKVGVVEPASDFPQDIIHGSSNNSSNSSTILSAMHQPPDQIDVDVQVYDNTKPPRINYIIVCGVSLLCLLSYFGQGSIGDWSAIFLSEEYDTSPFFSVFGLAGFNLCLCCGTFFSDFFVIRWGRNRLLILAGIVSATGLLMVSFSPYLNHRTGSLVLAVAGFSVFGLGNSVVPPSVISIAGSATTGMNPNEAIALVSSAGYIGIMIGPALLGALSGVCGGLQWSFLIVAVLMVLITIVTKLLSIQDHSDFATQRPTNLTAPVSDRFANSDSNSMSSSHSSYSANSNGGSLGNGYGGGFFSGKRGQHQQFYSPSEEVVA